MIEAGRGSIVNLHSVEGMRGYPGEPVYAAMKAGAAHFTTSLAAGVGRHGIRVNGVGPDLTQTPKSTISDGPRTPTQMPGATGRPSAGSGGRRRPPAPSCSLRRT